MENDKILNEGTKLGGFIKGIADGKIEEQVVELKKDAKSINTPEEKLILLNRTVKLLHKALVIKYNWPTSKKFIYSIGDFFDKLFKSKNAKPEKEINEKLRLIIADLSRLRDKILDTKVRGEDDIKAHRERIEKARKEAENQKVDIDDF